MARLADEQIEVGLHERDRLIKKIEELETVVKVQAFALDNSARKINEANERIVEFEDIKKGHKQMIEKLNDQIAFGVTVGLSRDVYMHQLKVATEALEAAYKLNNFMGGKPVWAGFRVAFRDMAGEAATMIKKTLKEIKGEDYEPSED